VIILIEGGINKEKNMSTQKLNGLLKQAEALTADEKIILAQRLLEQAKREETPSPEKQLDNSSDRELEKGRFNRYTLWIKEHQAEYAGRYVALDGEQLVGEGVTYREAAEAACQAGVQRPFIVHVPDPNRAYFSGW
jgi:hypothetical protein